MYRKMKLILQLCWLLPLLQYATSQGSECPPGYEEHPMVVVSMDGFRYDYLDRGLTPTLQALKDSGVSAPFMKATYPTLTFPNHYTIATGLYPESHGIIANDFYDPNFDADFSLSSPNATEGRWWGGEPVWNSVVFQGKMSATFFWPGSDAPIQNITPTYYYKYDGSVPYPDRVQQVLDWLALPVDLRPVWICVYFDEPDHTGHSSGPDSSQVNDQLVRMDGVIAQLVDGIAALNLTSCVNLILLSDHGMASTAGGQIDVGTYIPNVDGWVYTGAFSRVQIYQGYEDEADSIMQNISCQNPALRQYDYAGLPKRFHYSNNVRIDKVVLDLTPGFYTTYKYNYNGKGNHGYDNYYTVMEPLFIANGPDFRSGVQIEPFQNIELYDIMCQMVGVTPAPNNGTVGSLYHLLLNPPPYPVIPQEPEPPAAEFPDDVTLNGRLSISGCVGDLTTPEDWIYSLNFTDEEESQLKNESLPWGIPLSGNLPADFTLLYHQDHVTGYSQSLKMPLWTSFTIVPGFVGSANAAWSSDVRLTPTSTSTCPEYAKLLPNNIAMEPLFPKRYSRDASLDRVPFLASNAVPMTYELRNRWATLVNDLLLKWVSASSGPLNVVMGPLFDNNADSIVDDFTLFKSTPEVPSDLFLVATRCLVPVDSSLSECPTESLDAVAFIYPQIRLMTNCLTINDFALEFSAKVRDVEIATGFTFYPGIPYEDRTRVVIRIHSSLWPIN